jgi:hypothetical protein
MIILSTYKLSEQFIPLHNEELGLSVHVARMGKLGMHTEFWCGNLLGTAHLEDQGGAGRIPLSQRYVMRMESG